MKEGEKGRVLLLKTLFSNKEKSTATEFLIQESSAEIMKLFCILLLGHEFFCGVSMRFDVN